MYINSVTKSKIRVLIALLLTILAVIIAVFSLAGEDGSSLDITSGDDYIRFLDVGQGDSILISSNGKHMLIDTGLSMGSDKLCSKLRGYGVKNLEVMLLTHFHNDHAGGAEAVANRFKIQNLIYPDMKMSDQVDSAAVNAKQTVLAEEGDFFVAKSNMNIELGDFKITLIAYFPELDDENNRSIIIMAELGSSSFLLMSDAESEAEKKLLSDEINLKCDVLKIGHHGSSSSTSEKLLKSASPKIAVISCGTGNAYAHPHEQTLKCLEEEKIDVYRTDLNGDITFSVAFNNIEIECEKPYE